MIIGMLEFEDLDNDLANEINSGTHDYVVESESHGWGGSLWTFLLGGWIVSRWFRSDVQKEQEPISENNEAEMGSFLDTPSSIPKATKQVLSQIWLFEEEIIKALHSMHQGKTLLLTPSSAPAHRDQLATIY